MKRSDLLITFFLFISFTLYGEHGVEPIQFKANRVEYVYKKGAEKTICRGNARIWRSDFFLKANVIKLFGKDNNKAKAYGNVLLVSKTNDVIITGGYGEYDNIKSYAKVFKNPILQVTNKKLIITSSLMESYIKENKSIALGNVRISQTNYTAYSEKCVYYQNKDKIELTGSPIVYYDNNFFAAEKIIVYIKNKRIKLYGKVKAKLISNNGQENK